MQRDIMLENLRMRDINPLVCGDEDCQAGHRFGPAAREYYLLHYVFSGKGEFLTGGRRYSLGKGQIFVIRPGEMTLYQADWQDPWHYSWVGFESGLDLSGILGSDVILSPDCGHIFKSLRESGNIRAGREWYICGKIYELLSLLRAPEPETPGPDAYVRRAQNFSEANYVKELSVGGIAEQLSLDRSYFSAIFRRYTGKTPQQYIVDCRLGRAAELMALHHCRPGEAARLAGYTDPVNFSRMFKRRFGVPPREYAKAAGSQASGGEAVGLREEPAGKTEET